VGAKALRREMALLGDLTTSESRISRSTQLRQLATIHINCSGCV